MEKIKIVILSGNLDVFEENIFLENYFLEKKFFFLRKSKFHIKSIEEATKASETKFDVVITTISSSKCAKAVEIC